MAKRVKKEELKVASRVFQGRNPELKVALERNAILLAELAKIKEPVKSRRKQNKKQVELKVEQFISKTKPKDQLTERLQ